MYYVYPFRLDSMRVSSKSIEFNIYIDEVRSSEQIQQNLNKYDNVSNHLVHEKRLPFK